MRNLSTAGKVTRVSNAVAAGTTAVNGTGVSHKGFGATVFYILIGTITAGGTVTVKAQQSSDDGSADAYADLEGTGIVLDDTNSNKVVVLEVIEPREEYVRPVVLRSGANAVLDGILAVQHAASKEPVTHAASVAGSEVHHAPAEGTA